MSDSSPVEELFLSALAKGTPHERAQFLEAGDMARPPVGKAGNEHEACRGRGEGE